MTRKSGSRPVAHLMRRAGEFGLSVCDQMVDLGRVADRVHSVIDHIQVHDDPERFRNYGCEVLLGEPAELVSSREVRVGQRVIAGKRFVIATGSRPLVPPIPGLEPTVLRLPFEGNDRALTDGETAGLVKLVTDKEKILGASMLGRQAGELIHELVLAMQAGVKIGAISAAIHAYPTLAQIHRRVVNTGYAGKLFSPGIRKLVRWINRLLP